MSFSFPEPLFSALRAGVLSSCFAKKKVAKEEGDPEGDAGFAGPLRYSSGRAACQNSPAAQTRQADYPRPACVAQRLPRGPEKRPCPTVRAEKRGSHGQPEKKPKNKTHRFSVDALPGPLRGTEQRRNAGGLRRGLSEGRSPEFRSRPAFRVAQGTGAAGTDPGVAFSLATFFWRSKRKYARPQGGTPCPLAPSRPQKGKAQRKAPHA